VCDLVDDGWSGVLPDVWCGYGVGRDPH
jgi:hypothetical protein